MPSRNAGASERVEPTGLGHDLTACDREPIHVPGSIQPHGLLIVADGATQVVIGGAGDLETRLADDWLGRTIPDLLGQDVGALLTQVDLGPGGALAIEGVTGRTGRLDGSVHRSGSCILVELEPAATAPESAASVLSMLDGMSTAFQRASDLRTLCERAAMAFCKLTAFDRVMIYRFLDDGSGTVMAEERDPNLPAFLNHHFPASDIPKQARALYVRNRVRVIPDVAYEPQPLRPGTAGLAGLDLSDVALRSVSPIHVQYLKNMGVAASASVSIVRDGLLWGLVACHNMTPRGLTADVRAACRALASGLARQIGAKEEADTYRERLRLRASEDMIASRLADDEPLRKVFDATQEDLRRMLGADGFALVEGSRIRTNGECPSPGQIRDVARWVRERAFPDPFSTNTLADEFGPAADYADTASGLLALRVQAEEPGLLLWFRAEEVQVVEWAGNPHKAVTLEPGDVLSPRASFEAWSETVRGRSRPWTLEEVKAAGRLRRVMLDARQNRRLKELNRELSATVADNESLIRQKDFLLKEVSHRVQNSLQLVSAFLGLQARAAADPALAGHLGEAQRRLSAVALVHRRLYSDDQVETVDLARYLEELCEDTKGSMGPEWSDQLKVDLAPILISADRAVNVGLIVTELVINANKYAYAGQPGPVAISLEPYRNQFRLIVADHGSGGHKIGQGFGTRMMNAMIERLSGSIDYGDNGPGLRVIVTAPIQDVRR